LRVLIILHHLSLDCYESGFNSLFIWFIYKYVPIYLFITFLLGCLCLLFFRWLAEPLETSIFSFGCVCVSEFASAGAFFFCSMHYAIELIVSRIPIHLSYYHGLILKVLHIFEDWTMMYLMHSENRLCICLNIFIPQFVLRKWWVDGRIGFCLHVTLSITQ
jgi:hypothetical protein